MVKTIFSHTGISYIASVFTILASLSILQYLQVWCYFGDSCEEEMIAKIGYGLQRDYIENAIKQKPLIITEGKQKILYYIEDKDVYIQEKVTDIYYEMENFYIQVIYDQNNNSQCVFITAKYANAFTHPYLGLIGEKLTINEVNLTKYPTDKYIRNTNYRDYEQYFEYLYAGIRGGDLAYYIGVNDVGYDKSGGGINILINNNELVYSGDINSIDYQSREKIIPNTFGFGENCDNYHGVDWFRIKHKIDLK